MALHYERILVTGGFGFIGTALIDKLSSLHPKTQIRILDNLSSRTSVDARQSDDFDPAPVDSDIEVFVGDVRDIETVKSAVDGCQAIVHLAANTGVAPSVEDPRMDLDVNVGGTFNVLEAARIQGLKRLVFASSGAPAGATEPPIHEGSVTRPLSPYGASKLAGEAYCSAFHHSFGLETVCLRFSNVYGPGSGGKSSAVAAFIRSALAGQTSVIYGDGLQTRDFLFVSDLVDAVESSLMSPVAGEIFQIASGRETQLLEVVNVLKDYLAEYDVTMNIKHKPPRVGDARRNYSDIRKAQSHLGWQPSTPLGQGLRQTVDWFVSRRDEWDWKEPS